MDTGLLFRIFGTMQTLERSLEVSKKSASVNKTLSQEMQLNLRDMERVLLHMRQIANKLQMEIAKNDASAITRSLKVFYSLHQMLRPEVTAAEKEISSLYNKFETPDSAATIH